MKIPDVPWLLTGEPRPAQVEALLRSYYGVALRDTRDGPEALRRLPHYPSPAPGWGHFMEMRVGKTPTMLNEFMLFRRDHGFKRMVMFAPNKYKYTWATEAERFGLDVPTYVFESDQRDAFWKWFQKNPECAVFLNYEALIYSETMKLLEQIIDDKTYLGADESVFIKGLKSYTSLNALHLSKQAGITRPASGKPTPQGIHDLFNQLKFAKHLDGWNFFQFRNKYAIRGGFKGKQIVGVKNLESLDRLRFNTCFMARRVDWGTSIASDYETVKLQMTELQRQAYRDMDEEFMVWLDSGITITADQIITKHQKQQQISSGFIIDELKNVHWLLPFDRTPKFIDLLDRIENYLTGKMIIIFHYTATGDQLIEHLKKFKPAIIRGGPYMQKHKLDAEQEKKRFNEDPNCNLIIGQVRAIKYGHTLMGSVEQPCLDITYFENTYSLDDRAQTEERPQGEGQVAAIHIVDYWTSPVERAIVYALQRKEIVASKIMGYYKGPRESETGESE